MLERLTVWFKRRMTGSISAYRPSLIKLEPFGQFRDLLVESDRIEAFSWTWNPGKKAVQLQPEWGHDPSQRIRDVVRIGEAIHLFGKLERNAPILETL